MAEYLAIKNWEKYQSLSRSGRWIKDYTAQDDDLTISKLSIFQQGVLQAIRRIRGRIGSNVPNDCEYIMSAMSARLKDRPRIPRAISELIACGLLLVTNQQHDSVKTSEKEKEKEIKKEKEPKTSCAEASSAPQLKAVMFLPLNKGEFPISEEDFLLWKGLYPAVDVLQELRAMAGWCHANVKKRKTQSGVKAFINRWLAKAQNQPVAAQAFRETVGKAEGRVERNREKYARIEQRISAVSGIPGTIVPGGTSGGRVGDVDSRTKLLPVARSPGGS